MKILVNILVSSLAVILAARLLPGASVDSFGTAVEVAVVLGLVNASLGPLLVRLLDTVSLLPLALFTFAVTGGLVLLTARLVPGFHVAGFRWALAFAVMFSAINAFFHWYRYPWREKPR